MPMAMGTEKQGACFHVRVPAAGIDDRPLRASCRAISMHTSIYDHDHMHDAEEGEASTSAHEREYICACTCYPPTGAHMNRM
jgi:hypothetical protein